MIRRFVGGLVISTWRSDQYPAGQVSSAQTSEPRAHLSSGSCCAIPHVGGRCRWVFSFHSYCIAYFCILFASFVLCLCWLFLLFVYFWGWRAALTWRDNITQDVVHSYGRDTSTLFHFISYSGASNNVHKNYCSGYRDNILTYIFTAPEPKVDAVSSGKVKFRQTLNATEIHRYSHCFWDSLLISA